jgi:hypothetical protein
MVKKVKSTLIHPASQREMKIDAAIYEPFKAAIILSLKGTKGKSFTDLKDDVEKIIKKKMPGFSGSIPWYTISILRDLESKGIAEPFTEKGRKLNKLVK